MERVSSSDRNLEEKIIALLINSCSKKEEATIPGKVIIAGYKSGLPADNKQYHSQ
jgi:hypothetical protein